MGINTILFLGGIPTAFLLNSETGNFSKIESSSKIPSHIPTSNELLGSS